MIGIENAPIKQNTRVLVRCDIDVFIQNGHIKEPYRLESGLETLKYIIDKGGKPIIIGHIGSPEGQIKPKLSTKPLEVFYNQHLGIENYDLLENLRFDAREEANSYEYAQEIISKHKPDLFVNESFATSHRKHTSFMQFPTLLPAYAGFRLQKEIHHLTHLLETPKKPFLAIIGGAKLESKMPVVKKFLQVADFVFLGGLLGEQWQEDVPSNLILPTDYARHNLDMGENTLAKLAQLIGRSNQIVWAGPLGAYEKPEFFEGTKMTAHALATRTAQGCYTVVGGGDTINALDMAGVLTKMSFVSTGGGAMLQFISTGTLPGIEALNTNMPITTLL